MSERYVPDPADPTSLPLFAPPTAPRPGRVRGGFSMTPDTAASRATEPIVRARPLPRPYAGDMDWVLVATLRQQASDRLSAALGQDRGRALPAEQSDRGRAIITELVENEAAERIDAGVGTWTPAEQQGIGAAVDAALFGLGRFQPLVDDDRVENIIITGHDRVTLELTDGRLVPGPPVADSDQELIDFLVFLASRSEVNARPFSESQPKLHLRLADGSRLAAAAWVTPKDLFDLNVAFVTAPEFGTSLIERPLRAESGAIYDYAGKYLTGEGLSSAPRELPAQISNTLAEQVSDQARKIKTLTALDGICRVDFLTDGEHLFINEVNSIPGAMALYLFPDADPGPLLSMLEQARQGGSRRIPASSYEDGVALRAAGGIAAKLSGFGPQR